MSERIAAVLFSAFGLPTPALLPAPAPPERFPIFSPARPAPNPNPWHPERLALAGAVTLVPRR